MRNPRLIRQCFLTWLAILLLPTISLAASINLYEAPNDTAKVTGSIDLVTGVIPIYIPTNSQWMKVGDPHNGNTGWVKNSEMKDSHGNAITFSQKVNDNGSTSSMQMNVGNQPLTPAQQKALEGLPTSQQVIEQAIDAAKQAYQQSLQLMQNAGFPKTTPVVTQPASVPAPVNRDSSLRTQ